VRSLQAFFNTQAPYSDTWLEGTPEGLVRPVRRSKSSVNLDSCGADWRTHHGFIVEVSL
jgi:hypothetical protein